MQKPYWLLIHEGLTSKYDIIRGLLVQIDSNSKSMSVIAVCFLFFISLIPCQVGAQQPSEDQNFQPVHTGVDFPVAWDDNTVSSEISVRMVYPAMNAGESKEMAGNGPFPWVVFFGDAEEEISDYMLLADELAKKGNIVVVTQGVGQSESANIESHLSLLEEIMLFMQENNNSNNYVIGSFGQIDLNHWGIGGHGTGAAAAYSVYPFWQNSSLSTTTQPPRALFGLGVDFSGWDSGDNWDTLKPSNWTIQPAWPASALFITGTIDEIATRGDNLPFVNGTKQIGWQWMHVLGANHYQFQDETDDDFFWEDDRGDGDASISRQEQIDFAGLHLNHYFNLILRGDHSYFRDAFNRVDDVNNASNQEAYFDENLDGGQFILLQNISTTPENTTQFGTYDSFTISTNWTLRDGQGYSQIPTSWQIDVKCGFNGVEQFSGIIDGNGTAICNYEVETLEPGQHIAFIRLYIEGAPSTSIFEFSRTDTPLVFMTPLPEILVPERGTVNLQSNLIAIDPDGQEIFVTEAFISGGNINNFSVVIDGDGRGITVSHDVEGEFTGGAEVNVTVRSGGDGVVDENQVTLEIYVIPYNDPVVLTGNVPMQNLIEDGASIFVNISEYAYDPEGEPLFATVNQQTTGEAGPIGFSYSNGFLELTPLLNRNGATVLHVMVTDGASEAVDVDIPIQVAAVDDPVVANQSKWNIEVNEDETVYLNLLEFAYDIDGDQLQWSTSPITPDPSLSVSIAGQELIISPANDVNGMNQHHWLNVSDGNSEFSYALSVNITPVPDAPVLNVETPTPFTDSNTAVSVQWSVFDADGGQESPEPRLIADGVLLDNFTNTCILQEDDKFQCVILLELPEDHDDNVTLRVSIEDSDFSSEFAVYTNILYNQTSIVIETEDDQSSSDELSSQVIIGIIAILVLLILVLLIFIRRSSDSTPGIDDMNIEQEISVVEQELDVDLSPTGLLSRIQQKK